MHVDDFNGVKGSSMSRMFALSSFLLNRNTEVSSVTLAKLTQASISPLIAIFFPPENDDPRLLARRMGRQKQAYS